MNFVIFDLEWNNAYNYKAQTGMNEIIEIGAVMLDERLQIVDTFKQLILPKVSKRLTGRFKDLTHITPDEVKQNGIPFEEAFRDFARWSGADNCVFMSWSDSDLYVLAGNYKYFSQRAHVPFMQRYADAQKYCMRFLTDNPNNNQISLAHCAEKFQISVEEENLHRALEDCYVAAACFKKVYDPALFEPYICDCSGDYFERLLYKPYYLRHAICRGFDLRQQKFQCPRCHKELQMLSPFEFSNNAFKNWGECRDCGTKYWVQLRAKQMYDHVHISKKVQPMSRKRSRAMDRENGRTKAPSKSDKKAKNS